MRDFILSTVEEKVTRPRTQKELERAAAVTEYPNCINVADLEGLKEAARYDHIAGIFEGNHRANEDVKFTKCIIMDCDNGGSENPADWLTPEKLAERLKNIEFFIIYSKSHMKEKKNCGARPRFHVYFPLSRLLESNTEIKQVKEAILKLCPEFDKAAKDTARLIFGVENPDGAYFEGDYDILSVIKSDMKTEAVKLPFVENNNGKKAIVEGTRNSRLYDCAIGFLFNYATNEAIERYRNEAAKCVPALSNDELNQIWQHALKSNLLKIRLIASAFLAKYPDVAEAKREFDNQNGAYSKEQRARAFEAALKIAGKASNNNNEIPAQEKENEPHTLLTYLENSFDIDLLKFKKFADLKTGYSNLDKYISLYPGIYALGAISGLGKTTFCHQMADQIAKTGRHVLYFSLEQSEFELAAKGISRIMARNELNELLYKKSINDIRSEDFKTSASATNIKKGKLPYKEIHKAVEEYKEFAEYEKIIELPFEATIEDITRIIKEHADKKPVVFVDYLQIIKPREADKKTIMKEIIDNHVGELKKLSIQENLTIFIISSFNRKNYLAAVDFDSFKESGGIEYTSDVVWGLQLAAMNAEIFNTDTNIQKKRRFLRMAKNATPRIIELVGLKNRYGLASTSYFFYYFPSRDLFVPINKEAQEVEMKIKEEYDIFQCKDDSSSERIKD